MLLASVNDLIRVITSAGVTVDVHASYVDAVAGQATVTPGRTNTLITTATTTTVVGSPAALTYRKVRFLAIRNRHATTACDITVVHTDGTIAPEMWKVTLAAGEQLIYSGRFFVLDANGRVKQRQDTLLGAASPDYSTVVLAADVTNNNGVANTIADVTGLSFAVTAGNTYWFSFTIAYTAAAAGTGSRWSINGPAAPTSLIYKSEYSLSTTTRTVNEGLSTYDSPAASNATSAAAAANMAWIEGFIKPSANGTVIARFASEVASSAIVAKAGSILQWQQVL